MADAMDEIRDEISKNKIMVYMKGTPQMPQCGFSATAVAVLEDLGYPYASVDVLAAPAKRQAIKEFSNWPTIPQVYVNGTFIGGSDILRDMYESGELQQLLKDTFGS